ncbi:hypothetical protein [Pseudodesulfovibrio sp.]|uniref:hypothetical protein n=1 Tax=Pseudodesulfovibrio sp. TaxID=2035812 RepID=UPI00262CCAD9|nr:hypothetical protein [Pseudodesulfovibrio sp.]MDD3310540.1 hypothetical protein [Pseudodesulfovibrio sp.]
MILGVALAAMTCPCLALSCLAGDVALLHSAGSADGWTRSVARGLCAGDDPACRVSEIFLGDAEEGEEFFETLHDRLCPDWCARTPDAVVADGEVAFAFARKYRGELFGDAPVIYLGMSRPEAGIAEQCGRCSGVPLRLGVEWTVDLIFRLRPETSIVVALMDDDVANQPLRARVEAAMEPHLDRARLIFPGHEPGDDGGLDESDLASVAGSVPVGGAVLFLRFALDKAGNPVDEDGCARMVARRSQAPVYVLTDRFLGDGVLGGVVAVGEDQAREAANLAARLREGAGEAASQGVKPRAVVDLTVLARFGIPADRLPAVCAGINPVDPPEPASALGAAGMWLPALFLALPAWLLIRRLRAKQLK